MVSTTVEPSSTSPPSGFCCTTRPTLAESITSAILGIRFKCWSAVTAAVCLGAVVFVHERNAKAADERNLAEWQQVVLFAQNDTGGL